MSSDELYDFYEKIMNELIDVENDCLEAEGNADALRYDDMDPKRAAWERNRLMHLLTSVEAKARELRLRIEEIL